MNPKIAKLLHEGFSMSTLENLNENQLNILFKRINEEKGKVTVSSDKLPTVDLKKMTDSGVDVEVKEEETEVKEKSVSQQQQKIMGLALSVKKGDTPKSKVSKKVEKMAKEMSKKELEDFASTKHKGLPKKKETDEDVKKLEESILNILENHLPPHTTKGELLEVIRRRK
jgi:hypothetical protein